MWDPDVNYSHLCPLAIPKLTGRPEVFVLLIKIALYVFVKSLPILVQSTFMYFDFVIMSIIISLYVLKKVCNLFVTNVRASQSNKITHFTLYESKHLRFSLFLYIHIHKWFLARVRHICKRPCWAVFHSLNVKLTHCLAKTEKCFANWLLQSQTNIISSFAGMSYSKWWVKSRIFDSRSQAFRSNYSSIPAQQ